MTFVVFVGTQKPKKWRWWLAVRGWPLGGQDNLNKKSPHTTSQIWTSATCRNNSRMHCMCESRYVVLEPNILDPDKIPCTVQYTYSYCTGVIDLVPSLWNGAIISRSRHKIYIKNSLNVKLYSMFFFNTRNGVVIITFTFKQSIRAEVVA
jgi:hypothetical protein